MNKKYVWNRYDYEVAYWCSDCLIGGHMDMDDVANGCPLCGDELSVYENDEGEAEK